MVISMWHHPMVERIRQTMQFNNSICFWKSNWSKDVKGKKETDEKNIGFPGCHTTKTNIRNDSHCTGVPLMLPHLVIYFTHVARHHKPLPCTRTTTCIWHVWSSLYFPKNNSVSTARMKSSKDAAAQVAKRRAIPRLIAKAINLDFALSISLQTNKLPAQHTQSILYLPISNHIKPSFTHLFLHFYSLNC